MTGDYKALVQTYRRKGLLLDTNLALLLIIGLSDKGKVGTDKRLTRYVSSDFELLLRVVQVFERIVTAPHVLTELSNLSGHLDQDVFLSDFVRHIEAATEEFVAAQLLCGDAIFAKAGITDAAIARIARDKYLVLTDDFRLYGLLEREGIAALNFNHIRTLEW